MHVRIANREDPDQTASSEAVWSGSALFVSTFFVVIELVFEIEEHFPYICGGSTSSLNVHSLLKRKE